MVGETKIFVVMPAYNEAAHIGGVLHRVPAQQGRYDTP